MVTHPRQWRALWMSWVWTVDPWSPREKYDMVWGTEPGPMLFQEPPSKELVWDKNGIPLEKPLCWSGQGRSPDIPRVCGRKTRFSVTWGLGFNSHFKRVQDERILPANFRANGFIPPIDSNSKEGTEKKKMEIFSLNQPRPMKPVHTMILLFNIGGKTLHDWYYGVILLICIKTKTSWICLS